MKIWLLSGFLLFTVIGSAQNPDLSLDRKTSTTDQEDSLREEVYHKVFCLEEDLSDYINAYQEDCNVDYVRKMAHTALTICHCENISYYLQSFHKKLAWVYYNNHIHDSARYYLRLVLKQDSLNNNYYEMASHNSMYAVTFFNEANYDSAIYRENLSYQQNLIARDTINSTNSLMFLAKLYSFKGDFVMSNKIYLEQIHLFTQRNNKTDLISMYCSLGEMYGAMQLYEKEKQIINRALNLVADSLEIKRSFEDQYDLHSFTLMLFLLYQEASNAYYNHFQYDSAIYYARLNIQNYKKLGLTPGSFYQIAESYLQLNQIDSAKYYYKHLLDQALILKQPPLAAYIGLGLCETKTGNTQKANEYFTLAQSNPELFDIQMQIKMYKAFDEFAIAQGDENMHLRYFEKYKILEDSLFTNISNQQSFNLGITTMEFEAQRMRDQNELLKKKEALQAVIVSSQRKQKNIVYGSSALILLLMGLGIIRFRKYQLLKGKESLNNERLRISRDLHDEVGATLSGISMYSHLAKDQIHESLYSDVQDSLSVIQETSGEMIDKLSDIVWLLNPIHDTLKQLMDKLEDYAKKLAKIKGIKVRIEVANHLDHVQISIEKRRNIFLICKEAINNSIKYSHSTQLTIWVEKGESQIEFGIEDDGKGFDTELVNKGNGLLNMMQRAGEIGAHYSISSSPGGGTKMTLKCNLIQ